MQRFYAAGLALLIVILSVVTVASQPPRRDRTPGDTDRPGDQPPVRAGRRPAAPPPPFGPPPPFEPGRLMPPHVRDALDLTAEQEERLDKLEQEVKGQLLRILTADQKTKLNELRKRGPAGPPPGRRPGRGRPEGGGRPEGDGRPEGGDRPGPREKEAPRDSTRAVNPW